jgi:N-dimethylarginine dimethylaminohydrolase
MWQVAAELREQLPGDVFQHNTSLCAHRSAIAGFLQAQQSRT